jgi:hypothetical protein
MRLVKSGDLEGKKSGKRGEKREIPVFDCTGGKILEELGRLPGGR